MAIDLACPKCHQKYHLKDELAGKKAKCVKCGTSIAIPAAVAVMAEPLPDLSDLFEDFPSTPTKAIASAKPVAPMKPAKPAAKASARSGCPGCGAALDKSAVICVKCGYNTRTGQKLSTKHETIDEPAVQPKKKNSKLTLLKGTLLSFIGAMLGAGIWIGIAVATGYEIGYVAWGLGAAAGVGMAMGHDDDDGTFAGIIAAAMSLVGIFAAKYFIFQQFKQQLAEIGIDDEALAEIGDGLGEALTFAMMFHPIDALFILLAVGSAYKLGSGQATS